MYMPMGSKKFYNDLFAEVLTALFPIVIYVCVSLVYRILDVTGEKDDDRVKRLLRIFGVRKSVELMLEYVLQLLIQPWMILILTAIGTNYIMQTMSFMFLFVNIIVYMLNVTAL